MNDSRRHKKSGIIVECSGHAGKGIIDGNGVVIGVAALKPIDTNPTDGDHLVIRTLHACPPGGRELVGSDITALRFQILLPILTAPHRAMNLASAIKATVRGGTNISARRGNTQCTGSALVLCEIVLGGLLSTVIQRCHRSNNIIWRKLHPRLIFVVVLFL